MKFKDKYEKEYVCQRLRQEYFQFFHKDLRKEQITNEQLVEIWGTSSLTVWCYILQYRKHRLKLAFKNHLRKLLDK